MSGRVIRAADLFCGAGGTTAGLMQAAQGLGLDVRLVAVNHWQRAMETFARNHPAAEFHCTDLSGLKPSKAVPGGRLDLLVASPECTHHSIARGGKPCDDQSRASAWHVLHWCQELHVRNVIIENVPEFTNWGPLDARGRPLKSRRGDTFNAFLAALRSLGYSLDWRFLTAADYGDATTRRRFFLMASRGRKPLAWPAASHMIGGEGRRLSALPAWRPASEIIDWTIPGHSIFLTREDVRRHNLKCQRPLKPNTLRRIEAGIRKFWGEWAEPFLVVLRGTRGGQLDGSAIRLDRPLQTMDCSNRYAVMRPLIYCANNWKGQGARRIEIPLPVQTTGNHLGLLQPFILQAAHGDKHGDFTRRSSGLGSPIPTISGNRGTLGCVRPFVVKYNSTGGAYEIGAPLQTISTDDRYGLVRPALVEAGGERWWLDVLFRMLTVRELAAAHSFPTDYWFAGNKSEQVKQIGNSVPVATARALCRSALTA